MKHNGYLLCLNYYLLDKNKTIITF